MVIKENQTRILDQYDRLLGLVHKQPEMPTFVLANVLLFEQIWLAMCYHTHMELPAVHPAKLILQEYLSGYAQLEVMQSMVSLPSKYQHILPVMHQAEEIQPVIERAIHCVYRDLSRVERPRFLYYGSAFRSRVGTLLSDASDAVGVEEDIFVSLSQLDLYLSNGLAECPKSDKDQEIHIIEVINSLFFTIYAPVNIRHL